jgi:dephospho-CoA kinase
MIKIGITGSLASGKTTASQILSYGRGPLFSADQVVKKLYKNKNFKKLLSTKFNIKNDNFIKKNLRKIILDNKKNIKKLEKIIHPEVRINMEKFTKKNKNRKMLFYEIPLLIESNLMKYFNIIIFVR